MALTADQVAEACSAAGIETPEQQTAMLKMLKYQVLKLAADSQAVAARQQAQIVSTAAEQAAAAQQQASTEVERKFVMFTNLPDFLAIIGTLQVD